MNTKYKKSLKIVTLLISALIIATVSATVYYSLSVTGTATVVTVFPVMLDEGTDIGSGSVNSDGNGATLVISAYPGVKLTYENVLIVRNTGSTTPSVKLRHISISNTSATEFAYITIYLLDEASVQKGYINYTGAAASFTVTVSSSFTQMDANDNWVIKVETQAISGATNGATAAISIAIDVQE